MTDFVINEWLWHDSSGENGAEAQAKALDLIRWIAGCDHRIAIVEGSPFDQKAWALCSSGSMVVQSLIRLFVTQVRLNSDRCILLKAEEIVALPPELASQIKPDDHYLVQAQLTQPGSVLVTTDAPLCQTVTAAGLQCMSRDHFLKTYCP